MVVNNMGKKDKKVNTIDSLAEEEATRIVQENLRLKRELEQIKSKEQNNSSGGFTFVNTVTTPQVRIIFE